MFINQLIYILALSLNFKSGLLLNLCFAHLAGGIKRKKGGKKGLVNFNNFKLEKAIDILTRRKDVFEIEDCPIEIGSKADLTIFNPEVNYVFSENHILSSSKNCAYLDKNLKGIVYGAINNNKATLNKLWT